MRNLFALVLFCLLFAGCSSNRNITKYNLFFADLKYPVSLNGTLTDSQGNVLDKPKLSYVKSVYEVKEFDPKSSDNLHVELGGLLNECIKSAGGSGIIHLVVRSSVANKLFITGYIVKPLDPSVVISPILP